MILLVLTAYAGCDSGSPGSSTPAAAPASPSMPAASSITPGTNVTLDGSNSDPDYDQREVTVAVSEFYLDRYLEAIRGRDFIGAFQLSENHQIFQLPNGTHALLLEMSPPKAKVRIYGPPDTRKNWKYFGQIGWVLSYAVKAK